MHSIKQLNLLENQQDQIIILAIQLNHQTIHHHHHQSNMNCPKKAPPCKFFPLERFACKCHLAIAYLQHVQIYLDMRNKVQGRKNSLNTYPTLRLWSIKSNNIFKSRTNRLVWLKNSHSCPKHLCHTNNPFLELDINSKLAEQDESRVTTAQHKVIVRFYRLLNFLDHVNCLVQENSLKRDQQSNCQTNLLGAL